MINVDFERSLSMNRVQTFLYKFSCMIMIFFFGYVFYRTLGNLSHMEIINTYIGETWAVFFTLTGAATFLLLLYIIRKFFMGLPSKIRTAILLCLGLLGIAIQLFMILSVRPCLRYDSLKPLDTAVAVLNGADFSSTVFYEYFTIYPHNVPLIGYIAALLKTGYLFGLSKNHSILFLQLLNCLFMDVSIFCLFWCIRRHSGEKNGCIFFFLCILNPLLYYYPVFFYTQVLCIPFITLLLVLFFKIISDISWKQRTICSILYGVLLFFGWKIRIHSLIAPISCMIFLIFIFKGRFRVFKTKQFYGCAAALLLSFLVCAGANHLLLTSFGLQTDSEKAFPIHHWIMMGLKDDGEYNLDDELYTLDIDTKEERIIENTKIVKQRLSSLGISGLLKLWGTKLANTWSDGYDDYADNLMLADHYHNYNDFLSGDRSELLAGYLHIYNCASWLLITVCSVLLIFHKRPPYIYAFCLTILGGMIFHLFWESGEAYSMPFALLITAAASLGWNALELPIADSLFSKKIALLIPLGLMTGNLLLALHLKPILFDVSFRTKEWAAVQDIASGDYLSLSRDDTFTQTFTASRPFNRITLEYKYVSESTDSAKALLQLFDSKGNCLYEQFLLTETFFSGWTSKTPLIEPDGYETFQIKISVLELPENSNWIFYAYNTGNWDIYQEGALFINGIEKKRTDLTFHVYQENYRTFL